MNKRGSHVGIVLSFVLFVTAMIFLYDFIAPSIQTGEDKSQILEGIKTKIPENFEDSLLNLKISITGECCTNINCIQIAKDEQVQGMNFIVKNKEGKEISSQEKEDSIYIQRPEEKFMNIFFAKEGILRDDVQLSGCEDLSTIGYTNAFTSRDYYFEEKIKKFIERVKDKEEYKKVKEELAIPAGSEFSFVFVYQNGSRIGKEVENVSTNIFTDLVQIYYLNSTADSNPGSIELGVW